MNTDIFANGTYLCNTYDKDRRPIILAIQAINKSAKAQFLVQFTTEELRKYLKRLE